MSRYTEEEIEQIKNLVTEFTTKSLGNTSPKHMCFTICYPLSLFLECKGFKTSIRAGNFIDGTPHFWLSLDDDHETIIDPTIRQFYEDRKDIPAVYIGEKLEDYTEDNRTFEEWFEGLGGNAGTYEAWMEPLLNTSDVPQQAYIHYPENSKQNKLDLKILLSVNLNAAIILNAESEKICHTHSALYKKYFAFIFKVIRKYQHEKEWAKISFVEGFENLIRKAIDPDFIIL